MGMTRRQFCMAAAGGIGLAIAADDAPATPAAMRDAIRKVTGGAAVGRGRVKLTLPPLIDNGNVVPLSVEVESPVTSVHYVRAIHVFTERNPLPNVVSVFLGPRAGRARVATRVRIADTQTVTAVAELSDGSFWSDSLHVVVTLSACLEEVQV